MALNPKQFGTVMKNARMDKKLTQAELAEILDLSLSYLKDLERFKNTPSLEVFAKTIQYKPEQQYIPKITKTSTSMR